MKYLVTLLALASGCGGPTKATGPESTAHASHPTSDPAHRGTPPSVGWKPATSPDGDAGTYLTTGFPALSADGAHALVAIVGADDMMGTPHLTLAVTDLANVVVDQIALPRLASRGVPTAAQLQIASDFLAASQAKYDWRPMAWHTLAIREDGGDGPRATVEGFEVEIAGNESTLRLSRAGAVLIDKLDLMGQAIEVKPPANATLQCGGREPRLAGLAIDEAHGVVIVESGQQSRDNCSPDPSFAVRTWAPRR